MFNKPEKSVYVDVAEWTRENDIDLEIVLKWSLTYRTAFIDKGNGRKPAPKKKLQEAFFN